MHFLNDKNGTVPDSSFYFSKEGEADAISEASQRLAHYLRRLNPELTLDILRGIEGEVER